MSARPRAARALAGALLAGAWAAGCGDPLHPLVVDGWDGGVHKTDDAGDHAPGPMAHLVLTVTDGETGLALPSRVIFRPPPGAGFADSVTMGKPDPNSPGSSVGSTVAPGVVGSTEGVLLASGQGTVAVPPGDYTLVFTRGPEYELVETKVTVAAGDVRALEARLDRSVDTRGWLAADLHVHTAKVVGPISSGSFDSRLPVERRVVSMTSNGIEVIVTTDHDAATDLAPTIKALGYGIDDVGSIVGDEFTLREGHAGAYPVPFDPKRDYGGAPPWVSLDDCDKGSTGLHCKHGPDAFDFMRALIPGQTVVTINHPWRNDDLAHFWHLQWGAGFKNGFSQPLPSAGHFDAFEIISGYSAQTETTCTEECAPRYLFADFLYLLSQGYRPTALGSSDTHKINWVRAGWPRSWLRLPTDRPGEVTGAMLGDAIRNHRAIASTGPFATLTVDGAAIGDLVVPKQAGQVTVDLTVDAPSWMKVDTVTLYVNGVARRTFPVKPGARPLLHATVTEPVTGDSAVLVQAVGDTPLPGDIVGEYSEAGHFHMTPWVVTNPVYVDANGDGTWKPAPAPTTSGGPAPLWAGIPVDPSTLRPYQPRARRDCEPERAGAPVGTPDDTAVVPSPEHDAMPLLYP